MCSAFLYQGSFQYGSTNGNKSIPASLLRYCYNTCRYYDQDGMVYNLTPLQRTDGHPRFLKQSHKESPWKFSYNLCAPFKLGTYGRCFGDVAICMSTQSSYQNVGRQTTAKFVIPKYGNKHIEYTNNRRFPGWTDRVYLICDRNKTTVESASFKVISTNDGDNNRIFHLIHNCACPDGCPVNTENPSTTSSTRTPVPSGPKVVEKVVPPVVITAAFVIVPLAIWIYRRRQRPNDPLPPDRGGRNYGSISNPIGQVVKKKDTNLQKISSSSCRDIRVADKDDVNTTGRASAPI